MKLILFLFGFIVFNIFSVIAQDTASIQFKKSNLTLGNSRSFGLAIADVDGDKDNDVFICNYIGTSRLWLNEGAGSFTLSSFNMVSTEVHDAGIADLNGDDWADIFVVNHHAQNKIYLNNGAGGFLENDQNIGGANDFPQTIQLADVENDGDIDAIIYNYGAPNRIWLNNGQGIFSESSIEYGGSNCKGLLLADFNGDTFLDMFLNMRSAPNQIWLNDGGGNFVNNGYSFGNSGESFDSKDIDGDGDIDIVICGGTLSTWLNDGSGTFSPGFTTNELASICRLFDADLDGDQDIITVSHQNGNKLWLNDGGGVFSSAGTVFGNLQTHSISCKDLDGDSDIDVVLGQLENTGGNSVYFNESILVGIDDPKDLRKLNFKLHNNYPNPFNPGTVIEYYLSEPENIKLKIYDITGRIINTLVNDFISAGSHNIVWNGRDKFNNSVSSGVYFYQLNSDSYSETKKIILQK